MHFQHPEILFGIFALPLLALFFWWSQKRRRRMLDRFGRWAVIAKLIDSTSTARQVMKMAVLLSAVALLIVTLARPQFGSSERRLQRRGLDLMIAIDTSKSMLASDVGGATRITRAKEQLGQLVRTSRGHRIGILAFAGEAFAQCPLTLDYGLALRILDAVAVGIIEQEGTSMGRAIDAAVDAFERAEPGKKRRPGDPLADRVLLLLTDGEDHDRATLDAAVKRAAKAKIKIFTLGIGSDVPQLIKLADGSVMQDPQGRTVQTKLDFTALQKVAFDTNGVAVRGTPTGNLDLVEVQKHIDALEQSVQRSSTKLVYEERFAPVLAIVFALLLVEMFIGDRRRDKPAVVEAREVRKGKAEEAA